MPLKILSNSIVIDDNLNSRSIKHILNYNYFPGKINQTKYRKTEVEYIGAEKSEVKIQSRYN